MPSKVLLAASGRVKELVDAKHLQGFGIHAAPVRFERQTIADHANRLVATIRTNLTKDPGRWTRCWWPPAECPAAPPSTRRR